MVSADGSTVAFDGRVAVQTPTGATIRQDISVWDRRSGSIVVITADAAGDDPASLSVDSFGPSVSGDGSFVSFASEGANLVDGDDNGVSDSFVWNRRTGEFERLAGGEPGFIFDAMLSRDGTTAVASTLSLDGIPRPDDVLYITGLGQVTDRVPRLVLQAAEAEVRALVTGEAKFDEAVTKAADALLRTDTDRFWLSDDRLDPKRGGQVFTDVAIAVRWLHRSETLASDPVADTLATIREQVVAAMRALAVTEVQAAVDAGVGESTIEIAKKLISRGDAAQAEGQSVRAVWSYRVGWAIAAWAQHRP